MEVDNVSLVIRVNLMRWYHNDDGDEREMSDEHDLQTARRTSYNTEPDAVVSQLINKIHRVS